MHRANGGYLILDTLKVLRVPYVWEQLKRDLQAGQIRIETPAQVAGMTSTILLSSEPIPLSVKIILLGDPYIYYTLHQSDPDLGKLFKVVVDFAEEMTHTPDNNLLYARLIGTWTAKEKLRHLDRAAVARVLNYSTRLWQVILKNCQPGCKQSSIRPPRKLTAIRWMLG